MRDTHLDNLITMKLVRHTGFSTHFWDFRSSSILMSVVTRNDHYTLG
jgi:hypothetical protein